MPAFLIRGTLAAVTALSFFATAQVSLAQEPVKLAESMPIGKQYAVTCQVEVAGTLTLPLEKGQTVPKTLNVAGTSTIDYFERVQTHNTTQQVKTTVRMYRKLEFKRQVGDQTQSSALRQEVRRLVILRQNQVEVPFSPDGPLTWNEMDLVRTDVFTPALSGLLPTQAVRPKDRWNAASFSVQELTDLDKIESGTVACQLDQVSTVSGRRQARVSFSGVVQGVGEDGPTKHTLEGYYLFDLESNHLSYLSVKGGQQLLDKDGKTVGKIEGTFALNRRLESCQELSDASLKPLKLEPNEDNTQLLYDNPELGVKFLHSRRWRIAGTRGPQVAVDENGGSGLLLTVDSLKQTPTAADFLKETKAWLESQKAKILRIDPVRQVQASPKLVEQFSLEVDISGQKVLMVYLVLRQANQGATIAARVLPAQQKTILQDIEKMARTMQLQ